ncbi:MAG: VCBS repeat-containing protein [Calditrichaceae bacterium]|nr:VCBS repeat-containing protein [Calditrichaceae bacterium]
MRINIFNTSLILKILILLIGLNFYSLSAQNYTEVNVFGWGQAMDRGVPTFADIDNDGYIDMLVGNNDGKMWHLEQASGDEFALISCNFCSIDIGSEASPTITNIDNDGLLDLVIGGNDELEWYEQEVVNSNHFVFVSDELIAVDPGAHWTPALADLNNDGLLELIIGESGGELWYFEQDSMNAGTFSLVDEMWMDWDAGSYVHPFFTDLNGDSLLDLFVGETNGKTYHLIQDDTNSSTFHQVSDFFGGIDIGESAVPYIFDLDNDNKLDLFIGEWFNGLYHYEQTDSGSAAYTLISNKVLGVRDFGYAIGFTVADIDHDGLLDMLVAAYKGENSAFEQYEQTESGSLNFTLQDESFNDIQIWQYHNLATYDINGNELLDLFVSTNTGAIKWYEQDASNSYSFILKGDNFNNISIGQSPHLTFGYVDDDSLIDMIAGEGEGYLYYYEQDSVNAVTFTRKIDHFLGIRLTYYITPELTDIDGDSLQDLIISSNSGTIRYYEQTSPYSTDFTLIDDAFASVNYGNRIIPCFTDVNNDGSIDMFIAENGGGISLHLRNENSDITPPDVPQDLTASANGNYVDLYWTASEAEDLLLYNIYRSNRNDTTVAEYVNSVNHDVTSFSDSSLTVSDTYYYWLTALDQIGNESGFSNVDSVNITIVGIKDTQESILNDFVLYQNYPNPFNPSTTIRYSVETQNLASQQVELSIYNLVGQKVATLVNKKQPAGSYEVLWNTGDLSSGVYLYRLQAGNQAQTKRMILLK